MGNMILSVLFVLALVGSSTAEKGGWRIGRATFYREIHRGSCEYGYQDLYSGDEQMIAAMPDAHSDWAGKLTCGSCYEMKCHPMDFHDRYGGFMNRAGSDVCIDPNKSIVVKIIDHCPCSHNHKWCCGDMDHFDLSHHAFLKLSREIWGVIALKYRKVSCDHIERQTSPKPSIAPEKSKPSKPSRPSKIKMDPILDGRKVDSMPVYEGGFRNGFVDGGLVPYRPDNELGFNNGAAFCTNNVSGYRGVALVGDSKHFKDAVELEFWVNKKYGVPDYAVTLAGPKGLHKRVNIQDLEPISKDYSTNQNLYIVKLNILEPPVDEAAVKAAEKAAKIAAKEAKRAKKLAKKSSKKGKKGEDEDEDEDEDKDEKDDKEVVIPEPPVPHAIVFVNNLPWDQGICLESVKLRTPKEI